MKFIIMTEQGLDNCFTDELIESKLLPDLIVTSSPFHCGKTNPIKFLFKKAFLVLRYIIKRSVIKRKYQAYFLAKKYSIPLWPSERVNDDDFAMLIREMEVDYAFIFAFRILKENIYKAPKFGCINYHPALLPLNRGASPSNWIILNNEPRTGITFHFVSGNIDGGDIIEQYEIPLSGYETAKILNEYLYGIGAILFVRLILRISHNHEYKLIKNEIRNGTYQPLFNIGNSLITDKNTFQEINSIIRASRVYDIYALFKYSGKEYMVLNCVDLTDCDLPIKDYPFIDDKNNIYLRSTDNKIVLLVTKKPARTNFVNRFIDNLKERTLYQTGL